MPGTTLTERARHRAGGNTRVVTERVLGRPLAFIATAVILLMLFGWTFIAHPGRVAPTKDPAYYTWRTEGLISEHPAALLRIRGAFDMFAGGYRVSAPVLGGFLRQVGDLSSLHTTAFLMVVVPVATALLLGGFAYNRRRDALIFHAVALGVASLYLTPPFVGYLDNVLCLLFLAAAVWFIAPSRDSWSARAGLFVFLAASGFTHPTTLAFFCVSLGAFAALHLVFGRRRLRSVLRDDGPMLVVAASAGIFTYVTWKVGIWGVPASLGEAALPPPYGASFFVSRLVQWLQAMRPALNGPLLAIGAASLFAAGRRWVEDDLGVIAIAWLLPLLGLFGFVAGFAYPYYRFFNTTLAWVLLVGLGCYALLRVFLHLAGRGGALRLGAWVGLAAVVVIVATNLRSGFDEAHWNDPGNGWLAAQTRSDLDALRAAIGASDRPVVFVIDDATAGFQIWGFTKLSGNTSRYGLPAGRIGEGYLYLGSLGNFLRDRPTLRGEKTYDRLSPALLADARRGMASSEKAPIVVVASAFNVTGANVEVASGRAPPPSPGGGTEVLSVHDGAVVSSTGPVGTAPSAPRPGTLHLLRLLAGIALLLVPGLLAFRLLVPQGTTAEAVGMVPGLSLALLSLAGIVVLAVARSSFSTVLALVAVALAGAVSVALRALSHAGSRKRPASPAT